MLSQRRGAECKRILTLLKRGKAEGIARAKATELSEKCGLDIDDAMKYAAALSTQAVAIVSFDKDFDDLKVPRREPLEIVEVAEKR